MEDRKIPADERERGAKVLNDCVDSIRAATAAMEAPFRNVSPHLTREINSDRPFPALSE